MYLIKPESGSGPVLHYLSFRQNVFAKWLINKFSLFKFKD